MIQWKYKNEQKHIAQKLLMAYWQSNASKVISMHLNYWCSAIVGRFLTLSAVF